ncbi:MAG: OmpA family protein [Lautropia mirabilis]|jgi:ompA/motB domain protein|uniref:OmpA family protein n=1 Tax=Lautropia mirabilis TaxID=47671 RepID=UPI001CB6764E|nr:OmpA family protein [Lautropia mirabilis]MBF1263659.1 OmpA family protein [Lautropia mirabilis]
MNPLDDDTSTRTGLWVVFSTVTILLISVIIWVLKGADGANDVAAPAAPAAAVATSAAGHGQGTSTTAQEAAATAAAQNAASSAQTEAVTEEFVAFEQNTPAQPAGAIHFESASAALPADAQQALTTVVEALKAAEGRRVLLAGYHDPTGNIDFNRDLAKRRALGVRDALIAQGIPAQRIILRKPEQTTGSGNNAEARRVEILLID